MTYSGESDTPPRWNSADIAEVRAEARDVLSDALQWQLAETRWLAIQQILVAMEAALAGDDIDALAVATADLELAGPLRLNPIGPAVGPTGSTRDLLNKLVYSLGGAPADQRAGESQDAGAGNAGTSGR